MPRVIIVGAGGYVGRNLAQALEGRAEVLGFDIAGGYRHPDELETASGPFAAFYNLAWVGKGGALRADYNVQMDNVRRALDYYKTAVRLGCARYVCAGTIGELMVELPECSRLRSQNFVYINSKNYLHRVLRAIEQPSCRVVWARLGNLYGGGDSGGNLVDYTLGQIRKGEAAVFGPAEQPYDFVHATDAAQALALIGTAPSLVSDTFYVGSGVVRPLKDHLLRLGEIAGRPDLIRIGDRPDDGTRYRAEWFSIAPLAAETGYEPKVRDFRV